MPRFWPHIFTRVHDFAYTDSQTQNGIAYVRIFASYKRDFVKQTKPQTYYPPPKKKKTKKKNWSNKTTTVNINNPQNNNNNKKTNKKQNKQTKQ